jgi:soluble lytic murein transglycosylase
MPTRLKQIVLIFTLLFLSPLPAQSNESSPPSLQELRADFIKAEKYIRSGDKSRYRKLKQKLENYPLYPYLLYSELRKRIGKATTTEIDTFLNTYADTPLAYQLRRTWLFHLANRRNWDKYLHAYRKTSNKSLQCYYYRALINNKRTEEASSNIDALWLTGHSLPDSCDPVLLFWDKQGLLSTERVWQRIELAMKAGRARLAKHLGQYLPRKEEALLSTWYKVHRKPALILKKRTLRGNHPVTGKILVHGLKRLSKTDLAQAVTAWQILERRLALSEAQHAEINSTIGLKLAYRSHPDALAWLTSIPEHYVTKKIRAWRIRVALQQQEWDEVLFWISQLPKDERDSTHWQYWRARAIENIDKEQLKEHGESASARDIYSSLANTFSYEGFLAADMINSPYKIPHEVLDFSEQELDTLRKIPGIVRARELLFTGKNIDARREWYAATRSLKDDQLQMAAQLAHTWGWHDRAILTLGRSSYRNDMELRFPVLHRKHVISHAQQANIDPAWAFAVIRQESAFAKDARSHRDARGLMQLLPRTARAVARSLKTRLKKTTDLHEAEVNIRLGTHYLKTVLHRFDGHMVLATAAYNAGSYRVHRWLSDTKELDTDIWIETRPFSETRNYIQRVLMYTAVYEHRLGNKIIPLTTRMQPILPPPVKPGHASSQVKS